MYVKLQFFVFLKSFLSGLSYKRLDFYVFLNTDMHILLTEKETRNGKVFSPLFDETFQLF